MHILSNNFSAIPIPTSQSPKCIKYLVVMHCVKRHVGTLIVMHRAKCHVGTLVSKHLLNPDSNP
jgi:hypothetical protein